MSTQSSSLFTVTSDLVVSGPQSYMTERFEAFKAELYAGRSHVFNYAVRNLGQSLEQGLLIAVQTDFSSWKGTKELLKFI